MRVSYFSWLRTKTGCASEEVARSSDCRTVGDLVARLADRHPALGEIAAAPGGMRYTVNRRYVEASHELSDGDEVSLFPPVTGG